MTPSSIVVIGASAGGVETLKRFVSLLPPALPVAIFVVLHVSPRGTSVLPGILSRSGEWPAVHATHEMAIEAGRIHVAPPDHHLLIHRGVIHVVKGPRENGHRPSVDPMFRSAAQHYGSAVTGIILSGSLDDGTAGLQAVKQAGGTTIVQDPADALYPGMPNSAILHVDVDHVLPLDKIARLLSTLFSEKHPAVVTGPDADILDFENRIAEFDMEMVNGNDKPGVPSYFSCPDCGGVLWELLDGDIARYRCRVGHAWSGYSLLSEQSLKLENALWSALRALEERAVLSRRMADRMKARGIAVSVARFEAEARLSEEQAEVLRTVLLVRDTGAVDGDQPPPSALDDDLLGAAGSDANHISSNDPAEQQ